MTASRLAPGAADALLFDLGRVVLDIDFSKAIACWAGHAGCEPSDYRQPFRARRNLPASRDRQDQRCRLFRQPARHARHRHFRRAVPGRLERDLRRRNARHRAAARRAPPNACRSTPSPTPTGRMSSISRKPTPICLAISAKCICLRRSGFENRMRRPMIMSSRRSACPHRASCSSTISPRTSRARGREGFTAVQVTSSADVANALDALADLGVLPWH